MPNYKIAICFFHFSMTTLLQLGVCPKVNNPFDKDLQGCFFYSTQAQFF